MRAVVDQVLPFAEREAQAAAQLFNAIGRCRQLRVDAIIAATATANQVPLATNNRSDFEIFLPYGQELLP